MEKVIAIIDLGSNSIRMNISSVNAEGGYSIHEQASEMVRLSEGLNDDLILKEMPIKRTIRALQYFKKLIAVNGVHEVYALATAAVRMAKNQNEFLVRVQNKTGFDFTVLSGYQEAYYDYLGVVNSMAVQDALILDIGGGSTELIWMKNRELKEAVSLTFGSVTLTEKFASIKSRKKRVEAAKKFINDQMDALPWISEIKGLPIVGLGGVIRTLGKIDRSLNGYAIENLHNYRLHEHEVDKLCEIIFSTEEKNLDKIEGISKRRADIITMGIMPFKCLFDHMDAPEIRISGNGLRDGYFYERHFENTGLPIIVPDVLEHSVVNLMARFGVNRAHAYQVESLALKMYDALDALGYFEYNDRKLLKTAALLHDIGIHIEYYDHHVHGFYMIINSRMNGLTNPERIAVAYLVGSHREAGIKGMMADFENILPKNALSRLGKLVVLLNLAEQLDRAENTSVEELVIAIDDHSMQLSLVTNAGQNLELERASAGRFAERFEKAFQKKLIID